MSVVIRGMEMPKDRGVFVCVLPDGTAIIQGDKLVQTSAVEVEPHGRLIDADELAKEIQSLQKYRFSIEDPEIFVSRRAVMQAISDNPTVIEVEEVSE